MKKSVKKSKDKSSSELSREDLGFKSRKKLNIKQRLTDIIALYDELIYCKIVGVKTSSYRYISPDSGELGIDFLGTYSNENITFYYTVSKLPKEIYIDWKDRIRGECKEGVRVTFLNNIRGHSIAWESPQMRSRLRILREVREQEESKDVDAYNMHKNIKDLSKQNWIESSLLYLSEADKERGRQLFKSSITVVVSGQRGEDFDDSIKAIEIYAKHSGITLTRIMYDVPDFLSYVSPFNHTADPNMVSTESSYVLSDEILSRFNVYTQGTLGVAGLYFGTDIYSRFPVMKVVKRTSESAENILITAETGGGKSFFVKAILLQLLAKGYNGTIMDVEGFEYIPMANLIGHNSTVEVVNMGEGEGKYFDPMEIAEQVGIEEVDGAAKQMSINFTLSIFKVLLGRYYAENIWVDTLLNDAVTETYKNSGVTEDISTWHLSKGLSLFDVYSTLLTMGRFRGSDEYMECVTQSAAILSKYFEEDGTRSSLFKERLKVADIIRADLVVCSFGMAGKSHQSIDEVQLALMQLGAAQLSHQRSIFSKSQGKFNFKLWEEFQRWGKFPDSEKTLGVALTGGRKLGDVNIIITNVIKELLDDDRFGIFGNITSFLCGAIGDERVRGEFCDRLSIPNMKEELDLLSSVKKDDDNIGDDNNVSEESIYAHAFLCGLDRSKYGLVKMLIPSGLAKTSIFRTGVDIKK